MRRLAALLLALAAALAWPAPAGASGDIGCIPTYKLRLPEFSGCDSRVVLGPGNDTRVNLLLLMLDKRGRAPTPAAPGPERPGIDFEWLTLRGWWIKSEEGNSDYADGEGSRCRSNDEATAAFTAALQTARGVPDSERAALTVARRAFKPDCSDKAAAAPPPIASAAGRAWAQYLDGAWAFYTGRYDDAAARFAALARADDPWLKETARYLLGRVEVNRAQIGAFDEYGYPTDFAKVDRAVLARAEAGFTAYLQAYPKGRYANSARGLMRRIWWLGGRTDKLAAAYAALMAQDPATRGIDDPTLAEEIDNKLLLFKLDPGTIAGPLLLAVHDLAAMREGTSATLDLPAQRAAFANDPALYEYLLAARALYVDGKPAEVLRLIPDAAHQRALGPLQLARQYLRGQALEALRDRNARGFWVELLPGAAAPLQRPTIELAVALHDERAGALDTLFAPGSPVTEPRFREILLANTASPALLRRQARGAGPKHERDVALYALLYKELTRGAYTAFVADVALVPPGAPTELGYWGEGIPETIPLGLFTSATVLGDLGCGPLKRTAATLAANPKQPHALLCLADFLLASDLDDAALDHQPPADELGGTPTLFPGKRFWRGRTYRALIADPATPAADKAYALYRMVNCYHGTNYCDAEGEQVPLTQRRAWFVRLKKDYPASKWAETLDIYW